MKEIYYNEPDAFNNSKDEEEEEIEKIYYEGEWLNIRKDYYYYEENTDGKYREHSGY